MSLTTVCPSCGAEHKAGTACSRCAPTSVSRRARHGLSAGGTANPLREEEGEALEEVQVREGDVLEGKWRLEKQLGVGGMGTVWAAHEIALDRKVAIKVLNEELCRDEEFVARFEREARATARLEHPNVVPIHAVGRHGGRPFMVMKKLEGDTLAAILEAEERLSLARTHDLLRQLCAGLQHLHAHGCVHRDIKAGNVFVSPDGVATILDLGVVRDVRSPGNTQAGTLVGTPRYMSPEQIQGSAQVDHRADLYALGVLTYECLVGRAPFESESNNEVIRMHAEERPPDITELDPGLPVGLSPVLQRVLAKRPEDRYPSADAFFSAFEAALSAPAAVAAPAPLVPDPQQFDPSQLRAEDQCAALVPAPPRRRWPVRLSVLLGLLLLAGGALAYENLVTSLVEPWLPPPPKVVLPPPPPPSPPVVVARAAPAAEPTRPERPAAAETKRPTGRKPRSTTGVLKVTTLLTGRPYVARVFIDGVDRGKSPVTAELTAAQHVVRVERPGFQTVEKAVFVPAGGIKDLKIDMVP